MLASPQESNAYQANHVRLMAASFQRLLHRPMLPELASDQAAETADALQLGERVYHSEHIVLSHNTDDDPIFNYANLAAQRLFEMDWAAITSLPSRRSAEPLLREERERLLQAVTQNGFIDDYSGVRISATGQRFFIPRAIVWNVFDAQGQRCGQAATFPPPLPEHFLD